MTNNTQSLIALIFKLIGIIGGIGCLISFLIGISDSYNLELTLFFIIIPTGIASFLFFVVGHAFQKLHEIAENTKKISWNNSRTCPDCAELVKKEAKKCRFCGYKFDSREVR